MPELKELLAAWQEDVFRMERRMRSVLRAQTRAHAMVAGFMHEVYALALRYDRTEFWKTREQWQQEYGFTRANVETAQRVLGQEGLGVIKTRRSVGNRTYYELLPARFVEVFYGDRLEEPSTTGSDSRLAANRTPVSGEQMDGLRRSLFIDNEETHEKEEERGAPAIASAPRAHPQGNEKAEVLGGALPDVGTAVVDSPSANGSGEALHDHEPEVVDDPSNDVGGDHGVGRGDDPPNGGTEPEKLPRPAEYVTTKIDAGVRAKYGVELSDDEREHLQRKVQALHAEVVCAAVADAAGRAWVWSRAVGELTTRWLFDEGRDVTERLRSHVEAAIRELAESRESQRERQRLQREAEEQLLRRCLEELNAIEDGRWPWSDEKTLRWLREFREEFPLAEPLATCRDLVAFYDDVPGEKPSLKKLRAFFRAAHRRDGHGPHVLKEVS